MSATAEDLAHLRAQLEARFGGAILPAGQPGGAREGSPGLATGVAALDALLPGGVPRGALSLWTGTGTAGRTAALRSLVGTACAAGALVAVVDATRTLDAGFGSGQGEPLQGLWLARPPDAGRAEEGAWAAEALLRSGVFDLVVLDGCAPEAAQAHRLRALAREWDAALLVSLGEGVGSLGWRADARLEFRRRGGDGLMPGGRFRGWSRVGGVRGMGREREVELVYEAEDRLRPGAASGDRRPRAR